MISHDYIQKKIDAMHPGIYELRQILGIPQEAACPGPIGVYVNRHVGSFANISRVYELGPNNANIYKIH